MTRMSTLGNTKVGLIQFPGSNCDMDCVRALKNSFGISVQLIWHTETSLPQMDALIVPGGFSYGDYLRSGALAAHSPIMDAVKTFAKRGGGVIGICNGFQILTEAQLLPGALLRNAGQKFVCEYVTLKNPKESELYSVPIAHGEGRYVASDEDLRMLESEGLVAYQYVSKEGKMDAASNPNGSQKNIAGIFSPNRKILGLMPHPERAMDKLVGGSDAGVKIWTQFFEGVL